MCSVFYKIRYYKVKPIFIVEALLRSIKEPIHTNTEEFSKLLKFFS